MNPHSQVSLRGAQRADDAPGASVRPASLADRMLAYLALTKPRIIELLLVTTVPAMVLAAGGMPPLWLLTATLIGGTLAAAGANTINCYIDRDIDEVMARTRKRPLPRHQVAPRSALVFGLALAAVSFLWLWSTVNLLAAALAEAALAFYVLVYTIGLKRFTPQNIVIGGAAGAVPALVGWAAVTGSIEAPALVLFGIVFYWTPPHFWALALRYEADYAAAGVPMMPVVYGREETTKHILLYCGMLLAMSLILFPAARMGLLYLVAALVLNGLFITKAVRLRRRPSPENAWALFHYSIVFLALLFAAVAADTLLHS
jgi:heme o synthase